MSYGEREVHNKFMDKKSLATILIGLWTAHDPSLANEALAETALRTVSLVFQTENEIQNRKNLAYALEHNLEEENIEKRQC